MISNVQMISNAQTQNDISIKYKYDFVTLSSNDDLHLMVFFYDFQKLYWSTLCYG